MTASSSPFDSPKRKRASSDLERSLAGVHPLRLDAALRAGGTLSEDGPEGSPRSKVAWRLEGLDLDPSDGLQLDDGPDDVRKRLRFVGEHQPNPSFVAGGNQANASSTLGAGISPKDTGSNERRQSEIDPTLVPDVQELGNGSTGQLNRAYPSINRLSESKSRRPKRVGTPPLFGSSRSSPIAEDLVDLDRAQLTWHADEITGHTIEDPDDDGTGINGIGFRPTPQMAYSRLEKRRQQMAQYKTREAKEARARRNERRNAANAAMTARSVGNETSRRVRFMDVEVSSTL